MSPRTTRYARSGRFKGQGASIYNRASALSRRLAGDMMTEYGMRNQARIYRAAFSMDRKLKAQSRMGNING